MNIIELTDLCKTYIVNRRHTAVNFHTNTLFVIHIFLRENQNKQQ